jgi:hypothetical protein
MAKHVLVNKTGASVDSSTVLVAAPSSPAALTDGQLAIFNGDTNAPIAEGSTPGVVSFYVAMGVPSGRNPRISPIIKAGAVKKIEFKSYTAPVQPVITVGYQGSGSNNINFISASGAATVPYGIKIENLITLAPPFPKAYAQFTLTAANGGSTGAGGNNNPVYVCDQLAKSLNSQLVGMPTIDGGQFANVEVLSNLATTTAPYSGGTPVWAATNGSATITISGGTSLNTTVAPNDWIRIGSSTASGNTTFAIYQVATVTAISTTGSTLVLTRPYAGATVTGQAMANMSSTSTGPTSTSYAGLKISVTGSYFTSNAYASGKLNMMVNVPLQDTLAGTPQFVSTAMVYGSGTVSEVLKKEMQSLGDLGVENRIWMPLPNDTYAASNIGTGGTIGNGYSIFTLYYENSVSDKSAQGMGREETGMLDICVNNYRSATTVQSMATLVALLANLTGLPSGDIVGSFPSAIYPNW